MSYLDIYSNGSFNRKLASLTDLTTAVYWNEILEISNKVLKKHKFDENGFFKLDRKYIEARSTLNLEQQLDCDSILAKLGILQKSVDDPNTLCIFMDTYLQLVISDDAKKLELKAGKTKLTASQRAANKKEIIKATMKSITERYESDVELLIKYSDWVDSVYDSGKGFLNKQKIEIFVTTINNFTADKLEKLDILQEAIISGYTDPAWVLERYNSKKKNKVATTQKKTTGTSSNYEF